MSPALQQRYLQLQVQIRNSVAQIKRRSDANQPQLVRAIHDLTVMADGIDNLIKPNVPDYFAQETLDSTTRTYTQILSAIGM